MTVDLDTETLIVAGQAVSASKAEFRVVATLLGQLNQPLTKQAISDAVFGRGHDRDVRQIDMFVARLRRTLAAAGLPDAIATVPGRGYAMLDSAASMPTPGRQSHDEMLRIAA